MRQSTFREAQSSGRESRRWRLRDGFLERFNRDAYPFMFRQLGRSVPASVFPLRVYEPLALFRGLRRSRGKNRLPELPGSFP